MRDTATLNGNSNREEGPAVLTQQQLAARWQISTKKLEADRLKGSGCPYVKLGSAVRFRLNDVLAFEEANLRRSTSDRGGGDGRCQ